MTARFFVKLGKIKFFILSLGAFLDTVSHGVVDYLAHDIMVKECSAFHALLRIHGDKINQWSQMDFLSLISKMAVDLVLSLLAVARVAEVTKR